MRIKESISGPGATVGGFLGLILVTWAMFSTGAGHGTAAMIPFAVSPAFLPWPGGYLAVAFWSALGSLTSGRPSRKLSTVLAALLAIHFLALVTHYENTLVHSEYNSVMHALSAHPSSTLPFFALYCSAVGWVLFSIVRGLISDSQGKPDAN